MVFIVKVQVWVSCAARSNTERRGRSCFSPCGLSGSPGGAEQTVYCWITLTLRNDSGLVGFQPESAGELDNHCCCNLHFPRISGNVHCQQTVDRFNQRCLSLMWVNTPCTRVVGLRVVEVQFVMKTSVKEIGLWFFNWTWATKNGTEDRCNCHLLSTQISTYFSKKTHSSII